MPNLDSEYLIIGTGLCGLTIASALSESGENALMIEKSKGVGGRMATRRDGECAYDHGAQFYQHSDESPFFLHNQWIRKQKSQVWFWQEGLAFAAGIGGMTTLAKDLAQNQKIQFEQKLVSIEQASDFLKAHLESGLTLTTRKMILTCPLPQSLEILKNSNISYPVDLNQISYAKALVGLFEVQSEDSNLKNFKFKKFEDSVFSIANNQSKKVGTDLSFTVIMGTSFSEDYFETAENEVLQKIEQDFIKKMSFDFKVHKRQLKKWRFSHPLDIYSRQMCALPLNQNILLAGDAFGGGSLGGTVKSAKAVLQFLNSN